MKITLTKKTLSDGGQLYKTTLFGQEIVLSKALVEREKAAGRLHQEMETGDDWILTALCKQKGEKTYTNFYFTIKKAKPAEADEDIPF